MYIFYIFYSWFSRKSTSPERKFVLPWIVLASHQMTESWKASGLRSIPLPCYLFRQKHCFGLFIFNSHVLRALVLGFLVVCPASSRKTQTTSWLLLQSELLSEGLKRVNGKIRLLMNSFVLSSKLVITSFFIQFGLRTLSLPGYSWEDQAWP